MAKAKNMNVFRMTLSAVLVWMAIVAIFGVLSQTPGIMDSPMQQNLLVGVLLIPFAVLGAAYYYKGDDRSTNGLVIGSAMASIALTLDAIITVPLIMIPQYGVTHSAFFSDPFLWLIIFEYVAVVSLYWSLKVKAGPAMTQERAA